MSTYHTFTLTVGQVELLTSISKQFRLSGEQWIWPKKLPEWNGPGVAIFAAAWKVIAEHHRVELPSIAEHPDGPPSFLAKPLHVVRTPGRYLNGLPPHDFDDDERTPNR